jgi:2'-5' RNA ligase
MAFLGIRITPEVARLLKGIDVPGEKESSSEYHITLLCFEENWPISEIAKALEATYDIVSKVKPFSAKTSKITCFPKREDNPCPIIAKVESKELHDLRDKLAKEFDKCKVDFFKTFKAFKPHITLAYADKEIDDITIDPVEFMIQEIVLWGGDHGDDRIFITFPLKGPEKHKHSFLLQKVELFEKLANNPEQDHLTTSYERRKIER